MSFLLNLLVGPVVSSIISGVFGFIEARIHDAQLQQLGYDKQVIAQSRATIAAQQRMDAVATPDRSELIKRLRDGTQ